jgi:hypothetical protein
MPKETMAAEEMTHTAFYDWHSLPDWVVSRVNTHHLMIYQDHVMVLTPKGVQPAFEGDRISLSADGVLSVEKKEAPDGVS